MSRQARATAVRNLQLASDLVRLVKDFESEAIRVLTYKGPVLALLLYGDVALRQFGDLDLLIDDGDVYRAAALIESSAFYAMRPDALTLDAPLPAEGQLMFVRDNPRCVVELHWRVVQSQLRVPIAFDDLMSRATTFPIAGHPVRTLGAEDLVIVLAVHHTKHRWERLQWIAEFAELVDRHIELGIDLDAVIERARKLGVERMVRVGLLLSTQLWDVPLPVTMARDVLEDDEVDGLAREVYSALDEREGRLSDVAERVGFQRRSRDRTQDRLAMRAVRIFEPSLEDRSVIRLPRALYRLYYVIRPFRLVLARLFRRT